MNGPAHYRAAEEDMAAMNGKGEAAVQALLARAQVHATLALAAATADAYAADRGLNAWLEVVR